LGTSRNIVRARLLQCGELPGGQRSSKTSPAISPASAARVRIGYQKFGLLLLVKAFGALDAALASRGQELEWIEYPAGPDLTAALESEELDIGVVGECPPVYAQAADVPFVYVAAETPAPEAEAILVHEDSGIHEVADLRGRTIVLNPGANVHYLLIKALEEAAVPYHDVHLRFASPERARQAFQDREVDAWAIWDPLLASAQHAIGARVLRDGQGLTQNAAYYIARRDFADAQPGFLSELMQHVTQAGRWAKNNPDAVAELLAGQLGLAKQALSMALRRHTGTGPITPELIQNQQQIADTLHSLQLIPRAVSVADAQWRGRLAS
jgi:sulfonate transport system substrate-binding protein